LLDSWTYDQLRIMKVGGNSNAHNHFQQYGNASQYKDAKAKYTSKAAQSYREKLAQKAEEDAQKLLFSFYFIFFLKKNEKLEIKN